MDCGCCKDLGCYAPNEVIKFGVKAVFDTGDYVFHIWCNGTYTTINQSFTPDTEITLPFTFNENATTTIKIELPESMQEPNYGIKYVTTDGGSCCFEVHGLLTSCN